MQEEILEGGWGQEIKPVKIGETVHRQNPENSDYVHAVLEFLGQQGFDFAPKYLGQDDKDREITTFIEGYTPHGQEVPTGTWSLETMTEIFQQIRKLHDLTANSDLAKDQEVVCHGDLGYANTMYQDGHAIAFIDWDLAHAGKRVDDVAHAIMQYLSLGEYTSESGPSERAQLARKLAEAYGLDAEQRSQLIDSMLAQLQKIEGEQRENIKSGNELGKRLDEAGVPDILHKRYEWIKDNRQAFDEVFK